MTAERKICQNAVFRGKRHDNKILKVQILLSRNFVVIALAPIFHRPKLHKKMFFHREALQGWPRRPVCGSEDPSAGFYRASSGAKVDIAFFLKFQKGKSAISLPSGPIEVNRCLAAKITSR